MYTECTKLHCIVLNPAIRNFILLSANHERKSGLCSPAGLLMVSIVLGGNYGYQRQRYISHSSSAAALHSTSRLDQLHAKIQTTEFWPSPARPAAQHRSSVSECCECINPGGMDYRSVTVTIVYNCPLNNRQPVSGLVCVNCRQQAAALQPGQQQHSQSVVNKW